MHCSNTCCEGTHEETYAFASIVKASQAFKTNRGLDSKEKLVVIMVAFINSKTDRSFQDHFSVCHYVYQVAVKATSEPFPQGPSEISYQILIGLGSCTQAFV